MLIIDKVFYLRPRSQVVRQGFAKPLFSGSIPLVASKNNKNMLKKYNQLKITCNSQNISNPYFNYCFCPKDSCY